MKKVYLCIIVILFLGVFQSKSQNVQYKDTAKMLAPYQRGFSAVKYSDTVTLLKGYYRVSNPLGFITASAIIGKVNYTDTAAMLSKYYNKGLIDKMLNLKLNNMDTSVMLSRYIRTANYGIKKVDQGIAVDSFLFSTKANVTASLLGYAANALVVKYTDTASMLSKYYNASVTDNKLGIKLNVSDTATMLGSYYRSSNPNGYISATAINGKLNTADTASMLSPYQKSNDGLKYTDTASMLSKYYNASVTDNKLGIKLNVSDTVTMLGSYYRSSNPNGYITTTAISGKLNIADTASMLSPYQKSNDGLKYTDTAIMLSKYYNTTQTDIKLGTKLNVSDTATMLGSYYRSSNPNGYISATAISGKLNTADTASMLSPYQKSNDGLKYTDTASMLSVYYRATNPNGYITSNAISSKLNVADTAAMLSNYAKTSAISTNPVVAYNDVRGATSGMTICSFTPLSDGMYTFGMQYKFKGGSTSNNFNLGLKYYDLDGILKDRNTISTANSITPMLNFFSYGFFVKGGTTITIYSNLTAGTIIYDVQAFIQNISTNGGSSAVPTNYDLALKVNYFDTASMLTNYVRTPNYGIIKTGQAFGVDTNAISTKANVLALMAGNVSNGNVSSNSGTANYVSKFTGTNAIANSLIYDNGTTVGIGTTTLNSAYKLAVEGTIGARKVKVTQTTPWADYVFNDDYKLQPLSAVENYIKTNKHLPEVPSAAQVAKEGIDVGENQTLLLKKIEELTLYMIEMKKSNERIEKQNELTKKENENLRKEFNVLKKQNELLLIKEK
jgi:hypothetical protein